MKSYWIRLIYDEVFLGDYNEKLNVPKKIRDLFATLSLNGYMIYVLLSLP